MSRADTADECRALGWGPGTRLRGDEGYGETVVQITGLGERTILAKRISHAGESVAEPYESTWSFAYRDWEVVP